MKYEEVMENYPTIKFWSREVLLQSMLKGVTPLLAIFFLIYLALNNYFNDKYENLYNFFLDSKVISIFLSLFILSTVIFSIKRKLDIESSSYINWKNDYVIPYIKSLPRRKETILNRIDIRGTYGQVSFVVDGELKSTRVKLKFDENISEPYVTYVVNTHNFYNPRYMYDELNPILLANDEHFIKGEIYFVTLHLPIDYKI